MKSKTIVLHSETDEWNNKATTFLQHQISWYFNETPIKNFYLKRLLWTNQDKDIIRHLNRVHFQPSSKMVDEDKSWNLSLILMFWWYFQCSRNGSEAKLGCTKWLKCLLQNAREGKKFMHHEKKRLYKT